MKASLGTAGILLAVLLAPSDAHAAERANGFGDKGQLIVSADRLVPVFSYSYGTVTRTQNNIELTNSSSGAGISMLFGRNLAGNESGRVPYNVHTLPRVAFDVTVIPSLTLGAGIAFGFGLGGTNKTDILAGNIKTTASTDAPSATAIGLTPRVGYIFPLGSSFAFWPRLGMGIYSVSGSADVTQGGITATVKTTDTSVSLDLDPQFAIVPLEHFFILVGPVCNIPLTGSRSTSTTIGTTTTQASDDASIFNFGISASLGGWFDIF
jgi:hypothetical protein